MLLERRDFDAFQVMIHIDGVVIGIISRLETKMENHYFNIAFYYRYWLFISYVLPFRMPFFDAFQVMIPIDGIILGIVNRDVESLFQYCNLLKVLLIHHLRMYISYVF